MIKQSFNRKLHLGAQLVKCTGLAGDGFLVYNRAMADHASANPLSYRYPHPAVTVDCVIFGLDGQSLKVLLNRRDLVPFRDAWALPGGFIGIDEGLEDAARRVLQAETGVHDLYLEQLYSFGTPDRDPRERVITIAYYAIVNLFDHPVGKAAPSCASQEAGWFAMDRLPALAFDHSAIIETALARLQAKIRYQPIGFGFLPRKFTLTQLQKLYEAILCTSLDKRNFRKKILSTGLLVPLDEMEMDVAHRAAKLYRFDDRLYGELRQRGFNFAV